MLSVDNAINTCEKQSRYCPALTASARRWTSSGLEVGGPWAPWSWANNLVITGTTTTHYEYDANAGTISLCWVTVNNGLAPVNVAS